MVKDSQPKKIAILGGGISSLTTALELTSQPNWQEQYEITIYQLGWRLGGKAASGRNIQTENQNPPNYRIEEHGVHVWFGFYENAFELIQKCYEELNRPLEKPLSTWNQAFKPLSFFVIEEYINGNYIPWSFEFPMNDQLPGEGGDELELDLWEYLGVAIQWAHDQFMLSPYSTIHSHPGRPDRFLDFSAPNILEQIEAKFKESVLGLVQSILADLKADVELLALNEGALLLYTANKLANSYSLENKPSQETESLIVWLLKNFIQWLWSNVEPKIEANTQLRRLFIVMDLAIANLVGIIEDKVITRGFGSIDHLDYREWLKKHGALERPTLNSEPVKTIYDLGFAYQNGDRSLPNYAAGAVIHGLLRGIFTYKGAFLWKMQAGMGDAVIAPIYQVLKQRGVKFKFFHRVTNLGLSADKKSIETIAIDRQVNLKVPEYEPLISVKELPCWPSEPLYDQIENGEELRNFNLESFYTTWQNAGVETLKYQQDFDIVILGIPVAAFPFICPELLTAKQEWRDMVKYLKTTQTQAFQLWLKPDNAGLGWPFWTKAEPIVDTHLEPYDTWADMTQVLTRECWPAEHYPNNIAYFCSVLKGSDLPPPPTDTQFAVQATEEAKQNAITLLENSIKFVWPKAAKGNGFNWNLLVDPQNRSEQERFNSQYWRANIDPSERYVLSVAGSTKYRVKTDRSGFDNLYITGDWIDNNLNSGCIEAAVMSGMQTSRAISGYPKVIFGEKF